MPHAYILTGTNLGDRTQYLQTAASRIEQECGEMILISSVYETAAWGKTDQPKFLNQAIQINTNLDPVALLNKLLSIEAEMGRIRAEKYGPRTIDIDILLYDGLEINTPELQIPHPQLPNRKFALMPLAEIAPKLIHPVFHNSIAELLNLCTDPLAVSRFK
jgi:2-amino-4-hydroxy-6-hydroxymethyldihydropteridine diphosphokinase